jgi:hypothetical protein
MLLCAGDETIKLSWEDLLSSPILLHLLAKTALVRTASTPGLSMASLMELSVWLWGGNTLAPFLLTEC